jgi:putative ABC transport system permease protein
MTSLVQLDHVTKLTVLLIAVAGLGVLNTVVLQVRERAHDLGVFKAIGMTPRQTLAMVLCSAAGIGIVAGLIAIPAGVALHSYLVPVMGHAGQTDVPGALISVYSAGELALLALAGLVIAAGGAFGPAAWVARTRTATALRAE